ncbi:methyltransferase domain-containing protein [Argonema antarcticum]|uniref:methyltransferase domain-containing protein n=1 Tax=Argonema antarcticum TaxID=2942763 RepID=UPI00201283C7|nr:methyltransferase domain-containing protein [Argonema antarcticum]MCL1472413.1 methyltransferase domain-containing protein [Argonema antarcticum A004/B2]
MNSKVKFTDSTQELLCCPVCQSKLTLEKEKFKCTNPQCETHFPVVDGIPILVNESNSIFSIGDFLKYENTTFDLKNKSKIKEFITNLLPGIDVNVKTKENYQNFAEVVLKLNKNPKILILGGSILGKGMEPILSVPSIEIISSDVSFGPYTALICDAHDIPFEDNSFDAVIIQAVLEHVLDPTRCVSEVYRVLKKDGIVYAETPFMQQVHMGRYDFTRFTYLGHRRLFRHFEELNSGPACGPGMALAWSYQYFLLSFVNNKTGKALVKGFARLTSFWLKYFDYYLIDKPGAFDAASGYYFMGKKSDRVLSDQELLQLYKGIQ